MPEIKTPLITPDITTKPPLDGKQQISADIQQSLALLCGHFDSVRKMLTCLPSGVLCVASNVLADVIHVTATGTNFAYQGEDIPCSEVIIVGYPTNTGLVWVRRDTAAAITNAYPLDSLDHLKITLTNLNHLRLLIAVSGEKAIILYTR